MLDDVNNFGIPIDTIIDTHFNRENYLTWFAINLLFENLDTNSQNFFLYSSTTNDAWYFMPWDYDDAWGFYEQPVEVLYGSPLPRWQQGISNWWGVVLHQRFVSEPENLADLLVRVEELFETIVTPERTGELLESYRTVIESFLAVEPDLEFLPIAGDEEDFASEFAGEYERLINLPGIHMSRLLETLEWPMPVYLADVIAEDGGLRFEWDESFDLQGDGITYDFQVSRSPSFDTADIFIQRLDLEVVELLIMDPVDPGDYFWRVIIRDTKDPEVNWQIAFDSYEIFDGEDYQDFHRTRKFTVD